MVIERDRWVRAILFCTTCRIDVVVGPPCEREPMAAYELGRVDAARGPLHIGICAGGALDVRLEEVPNDAPADAAPRAHDLRVVYDDDQGGSHS